MSGIRGCNDWERQYRPHRDHIRRLTGLSKAARIRTNRELASELYGMATDAPDDEAMTLCEAAERLSAVQLTEDQNLGEN